MFTIDPNAPRRSAMREMREMVPAELTQVLVAVAFAERYHRLCNAHPPRLLSVTGAHRLPAIASLGDLGRLHKGPGGTHVLHVADQPAGVEFQFCWRTDSRVEGFLSILEADVRRGSNFAILAHAARTAPPSAATPSHPRPYAAGADELRAVVAEMLALALEAGRRFVTRPGSRWQPPVVRTGRRRVPRAAATRVDEAVTALAEDLADLNFQPGLEQLANLKARHAAFEAMLRRKLSPAELTYVRYLGTSEQLLLAALDNLARVVDTLESMSAIDVAHISRRLRHLETDGIESPAQDAEIQALRERLQLLEARHGRVNELLVENETGMTRLAHATAAIADMDTQAPRAQVDMETAMRELQALIDRAPDYSRD